MQKLSNQSKDISQENIKKVEELFPNCVTETYDQDGNLVRSIDFDILRQDLSDHVVESPKERYQFNWPGKREAILLANAPTTNTLRPLPEKSVDFEHTKNVYIEGDNLEALKILRETYMGKIKMIYIDPPYNTGNDFVYKDDFKESTEEYLKSSGNIDEEGNRMAVNGESNGRFHSDWLNMMYPRLILARDLLTDDGVIFISIDENEVHNMRKICDEIFGEQNFISQLGWQKVYSPKNQARYFSNDYEFVLCYCKNSSDFTLGLLPRTAAMNSRYKNPDNDPRGDWKPGDCVGNGERKNGYYDVISPITGKVFNVPRGKHWVYAPETMKTMLSENRIYFGKDGNAFPAVKQFLSDVTGRRASSLLLYEDYGHTDMAKKELINLFPDLVQVPFDTPKPVKLIKMLTILGTKNDDIVLDFFSGSATTAQAVMELNSEDSNSHRRYILVQIPENLENNPEAEKIGLKTIADVGEERIRRAGRKISEDSPLLSEGKDFGFRTFKLDSSNTKENQYIPTNIQLSMLEDTDSAIKPDRNPLDLVTQVMLRLDIALDAKIKKGTCSSGTTFYSVNENDLICCFDKNVSESDIEEIARMQPLNVAFRDDSFASDQDEVNCEQIFKTLSPITGKNIFVL